MSWLVPVVVVVVVLAVESDQSWWSWPRQLRVTGPRMARENGPDRRWAQMVRKPLPL